MCAVVGSSVVGEKLRACVTGGSTTGGLSWTDFHYYSQRRGMQQIDAMMHSWIANLAYAKYGRRDMQAECGAGSHDYNRKTGGTMSHGMEDTIGYEAAKAIKADVTNSVVDGSVRQYAWYKAESEYGVQTVVQVVNTCTNVCTPYSLSALYDAYWRTELSTTDVVTSAFLAYAAS